MKCPVFIPNLWNIGPKGWGFTGFGKRLSTRSIHKGRIVKQLVQQRITPKPPMIPNCEKPLLLATRRLMKEAAVVPEARRVASDVDERLRIKASRASMPDLRSSRYL